jgi:hypothetical protein
MVCGGIKTHVLDTPSPHRDLENIRVSVRCLVKSAAQRT